LPRLARRSRGESASRARRVDAKTTHAAAITSTRSRPEDMDIVFLVKEAVVGTELDVLL
jgi:hypothetical protein